MSAVLNTESSPAVTSLAELRRPPQEYRAAPVSVGFGSLQGFELLQRGAKALAASSIIPKDYVGNVANCMVGLEMADRIGVSPLMLMQNMDVIHGRPALRAKFLIATFNQCGRYTTIKYLWQGTPGKEDWGCRATCTEKSTGDTITGPLITMELARKEGWIEKSGSKWKTIPELMLTYRAAAWMVNTTAPELSMGLPTTEEAHDTFDAKRGNDGSFVVAGVSDLHNGAANKHQTIDAEHVPESVNVDHETGEVTPKSEATKPEPVVRHAKAKPTPKDATENEVHAITYAHVINRMQTAFTKADLDMLKIEADLIKQVADEQQQKELYGEYLRMEESLTGGDAA